MPNPITLAIVGATGKKGKAIAKALSGYYRLLLSAEKIPTLARLQTEIKSITPHAEIEPVECSKDACWEADIIILAVDSDKLKEVAGIIKQVAANKIVIIVDNQEVKTYNAGVDLQNLLPKSNIIYADDSLKVEDKNDENIKTILAIISSACKAYNCKENVAENDSIKN